MRAERAAPGWENAAQGRLSLLRTIMNSDLKKENVARRCRATGEHCAVSGAESFGCAAPCETCAESLTVLPAAAQQHFQQHTCVFSSRHSSRYLFSPPFVLQEKSLGWDAEAQQLLSCSFVPTRTCQLINCASRVCATSQLLCLSTPGCCCIGCKFLKGGSTMTSRR